MDPALEKVLLSLLWPICPPPSCLDSLRALAPTVAAPDCAFLTATELSGSPTQVWTSSIITSVTYRNFVESYFFYKLRSCRKESKKRHD